MATPCTTTIVVTHHLPADGPYDDPVVLLEKVEFMHEEGGDSRSEAIAKIRQAHDDRDAAAGSMLHYDLQDQEWRMAEISAVLIGHGLATLT